MMMITMQSYMLVATRLLNISLRTILPSEESMFVFHLQRM